jgi:hypothetical protein
MRAGHVALASVLAVQVACASGAKADSASATSVVGKRVADNVLRADAGLVAACGTGPYPAQFHACLEAVMAEQRNLVLVESDVRLIESSASANANEAGLKAGLRQGFEGLTAALTPLRSALQEGSRVYYYSSHFVARDATGNLVGYALALSDAPHMQPAHQAADPTMRRTGRLLALVIISVLIVGVLATGYGAVRRRR